MVTISAIKKTSLTFKQLDAAIAFVKLRFNLTDVSQRQLADLVNKEFNTTLTEKDIQLHFDSDLDTDVEDIKLQGRLMNFIEANEDLYDNWPLSPESMISPEPWKTTNNPENVEKD